MNGRAITFTIAFSVTLIVLIVLVIGNERVLPVKRQLDRRTAEINLQLFLEYQSEYLPYEKRWKFPRYRLKLGELLVIVEYCRYGNLQAHLVNHRSHFINLVDEFGNMKSANDMDDADHMERLNSEEETDPDIPLKGSFPHVLQGDLAARNVLLADGGVVKITDFRITTNKTTRKPELMPVKYAPRFLWRNLNRMLEKRTKRKAHRQSIGGDDL